MDSEKLRKIAADLREAKRYVRSDIDEARRQVGSCVATINGIAVRREIDERGRLTLERLATNLAVGLRFAQVMPEMIAGYARNAAFELETLAGPIGIPDVTEPAS